MSRKLAAQAKEGALVLQHCGACETAIYPPREICPNCLSGDIDWRPIDGAGEVLVASNLSHSFDAAIAANLAGGLQVRIVSVNLDLGPVVIAYAGDEDIAAGDRVCLTLHHDEPVLLAVKTEDVEA